MSSWERWDRIEATLRSSYEAQDYTYTAIDRQRLHNAVMAKISEVPALSTEDQFSIFFRTAIGSLALACLCFFIFSTDRKEAVQNQLLLNLSDSTEFVIAEDLLL